MGTFAFALFFVLPVLLHLAFDFAVSVSVFFFEFVAAMFLALTFSLFLVFAVFFTFPLDFAVPVPEFLFEFAMAMSSMATFVLP